MLAQSIYKNQDGVSLYVLHHRTHYTHSEMFTTGVAPAIIFCHLQSPVIDKNIDQSLLIFKC